MTDVLGICESWAGGVVTVRREDGSIVEIATADIVSGKPVPPRPSLHRRLDDAQADRLALPGWQPVESEPLGEWLLRASGGFSSRGNSVLALGDPGMPVSEAVAQVTRWYAARSLPARAHVHPDRPEADAFAEAGWSVYDPTLLLLASVAKVIRKLGPQQVAEPQHDSVLDEAWLATDDRAATVRRERTRGHGVRRGHLRHRQGRTRCGAGAGSRRLPRRLGRCLRALDGPRPPRRRPEQRRAAVTGLVGGRARGDHGVPPGGRVERARAPPLRGARVRRAPSLRLPRRRGWYAGAADAQP